MCENLENQMGQTEVKITNNPKQKNYCRIQFDADGF